MAQEKDQANALASGVAGAIIGAAAAAAAIALSDEKNRKKAEGILKDLQKSGDKIIKEISRRALEIKEMGVKSLPKPKKQTGRKKVVSKKKK